MTKGEQFPPKSKQTFKNYPKPQRENTNSHMCHTTSPKTCLQHKPHTQGSSSPTCKHIQSLPTHMCCNLGQGILFHDHFATDHVSSTHPTCQDMGRTGRTRLGEFPFFHASAPNKKALGLQAKAPPKPLHCSPQATQLMPIFKASTGPKHNQTS
jgi:hypothetical protein